MYYYIQILHNNKIITVFSASYYCGYHKNQGAIIIINHTLDPISIQYYSCKNLYYNFYKIPSIEEFINNNDNNKENVEEKEKEEKINEIENEMNKKIKENVGKIYNIINKYDKYNSGFV